MTQPEPDRPPWPLYVFLLLAMAFAFWPLAKDEVLDLAYALDGKERPKVYKVTGCRRGKSTDSTLADFRDLSGLSPRLAAEVRAIRRAKKGE